MTDVVDTLAFGYAWTKRQITATWNGIDHVGSYGLAGNELTYFATRTYSPRNLLASVTDSSGKGAQHTISYGYDARGVRVTRSESPTASGTANRYYTYSPELQLLNVTDDDSSNVWASGHASIESAPVPVSHEYAYFNGIPVGEYGPPRTPDSTVALTQTRHRTFATATTQYYTFADHLGTPLLQTDGSGAVVWRAEHEPYGNVWKMRTGSRTDQPLRLPGQDLAMTWEGGEENYNVFRWYRAGWGRYTQGDPAATAQKSFRYYSYALENPISPTDPRGLFTVDPFCKSCKNPIRTKDKSNLFQHIMDETTTFCQSKLGYIKDVALRDCMKKSCQIGTVNCDISTNSGPCKDPGVLGYTSMPLFDFVAKIWPRRNVYICSDHVSNSLGMQVTQSFTNGLMAADTIQTQDWLVFRSSRMLSRALAAFAFLTMLGSCDRIHERGGVHLRLDVETQDHGAPIKAVVRFRDDAVAVGDGRRESCSSAQPTKAVDVWDTSATSMIETSIPGRDGCATRTHNDASLSSSQHRQLRGRTPLCRLATR